MLMVGGGAGFGTARDHPGRPVCVRLQESLRKVVGEGGYDGWKVEAVVVERCSNDVTRLGLVASRPGRPDASYLGLTVAAKIEVQTAKVAAGPKRAVKSILGSVLARTWRLFSFPAVNNFMQRYRPGRLSVEYSAGSLVLEAEARVVGTDRRVRLVLGDEGRDPVERYQVPGIDAFCGRRELLRLAEVISDEYPGCRAVWVEGVKERAGNNDAGCSTCPEGDEDCIPDAWRLRAVLEGAGCPPVVSVRIGTRLDSSEPRQHGKWEDAGWPEGR